MSATGSFAPMPRGEAPLSRRRFLVNTALASAAAGLPLGAEQSCLAADLTACPVLVFSKIYQELKLDFEAAAALTAEAGLDGVDCPVRPGGEILPERVAQDLPRYAEILRARNLKLGLLTTAITSPSSPHAEEVLQAAKRLGVRYYRIGFFERQKSVSIDQQAREIRAKLTDLAAFNKQAGMTGVFQNHSGSFGADLAEARQVLDGLDPATMGLAFDIGHALLIHGEGWRVHFEALKSHLRLAYVKDATRGQGWVPFGRGQISGTGYFKLLRDLGYNAPFSLHIEFDWSQKGKARNRAALLEALGQSTKTLRSWLAQA